MVALLPLLSLGFLSSDTFDSVTEEAEGWFMRVAFVGLALFFGWGILMFALAKLGFFEGLFKVTGQLITSLTGVVTGAFKAVF